MFSYYFGLIILFGLARSTEISRGLKQPSESSTNSGNAFSAIEKLYNLCEASEDVVRCLKIQGLKIAGRALKVQNIRILDGISIVKKSNSTENQRSLSDIDDINGTDIENLSAKSLNKLFYDRLGNLVDSHQVQVNIPRLLVAGEQESGRLVEEGRKKMKKYLGPFIAAILLKAGILKMAYHSIAIVAGKALIIGKIALIISAIIGLKKLVAPEGQEKTTYEIVKHPQVQQSHTYSSSHASEYDGGHEGGGSYHRSLNAADQMLMQDKAYSGWIPTDKV